MTDSKLLMIKLLSYGFNNSAIKLLQNYFDDRTQITTIENFKSTPAMLKLGMPQGSVLVPLLFSIFINNLPVMLSSLSMLFAD